MFEVYVRGIFVLVLSGFFPGVFFRGYFSGGICPGVFVRGYLS